MNKGIVLLLAPIILGLGSGYLVSQKQIPKVDSKFNPPGWLFAVVWPILYLLLGYSSYLIFNSNSSKKNLYLKLYFIQVLLTISWWPYFLYYPNKVFSVITLIALAIFALILSKMFFTVNKVAGYCLVPYIIWLSFASFLTSRT
jgi:tryptophan-rich sensory protein